MPKIGDLFDSRAPEVVARSLKQWIHHQDNEKRLENYKKYEDYYDGDFDFHLAPKVKEALGTDYAVIANYAKTVVNKAVGYLCGRPIGIQVIADLFDIEDKDKKEVIRKEAKNVERFLYNVYRDNQFLKQNIIKLIRMQGKKGETFVKAFVDPEDKKVPIKLRVIKPEFVFPKFKDDDYQSYEYIAIIITRYDKDGKPYKYAQVFWDDIIREYEQRGTQDEWEMVSEHKNEIGMIPIVHIKNTEDDRPWGESDIEIIMTLIDGICKALTDMVCNADYQSFQRVFTTGANDSYDPDQEKPGAEDKQETGPGTRTNLPDPQASVHVVDPVNPEGIISIIKTLRQEISAHARVPAIAFSQADGAGAASSLSLRIHYQPLDEKCNEKAVLAGNGLQRLNDIIFAYQKWLTKGKEDYTDFQTEIRFNKSMPVDRKEEEDIRDSQIQNKIKSRETAMEEIGIEDPEGEKEKILREQQEFEMDLYTRRADEDIETLLGGGGEREVEL